MPNPTKTIQIFDPPLCCSTGVCGPDVDPELARMGQDVSALQEAGADVQRFNLAQEPAAFADNEVIQKLLEAEGNDALPVVLVDGAVAMKGLYPTREQLFKLAGVIEPPCCDSSDSEDCSADESNSSCSTEEDSCCDNSEESCC